MSNGDELTDKLKFDEHFKALPPEERTIFIAQQTYNLTTQFDNLSKKIDSLGIKFDDCINNNGNKKTSALSGGISGGVIAAAIALVEYFKGR